MKLEQVKELNELAPQVLEQLGIESDDELYILSDIANHGIMGGYAGFTYHSDTLEFWNKNRIKIRASMKNTASELGQDMFSMIAGFNCLKDLDLSVDEIAECIYTDEETGNRTAILNACAWYAAEEVARAYEDHLVDMMEGQGE